MGSHFSFTHSFEKLFGTSIFKLLFLNSFGFADTLASSTSKELSETLVFSESLGLQPSKSVGDAGDVISISDLVAIANISGKVLNGAPFNTTTLN